MHTPVWLVRCGITTLVATGLAGCAALAQEAEPLPPVTLHVYTDLLQVPVLVLDDAQRPIAGLKPKQFRLSVDSGPMFQPPYVRREGDDPLAMTILVDANGLGAAAEARIASAVGALAQRSLAQRDRAAIEALSGCAVSEIGPFAVTSATDLEAKVAKVFNAQSAATAGAGCGESLQLRDAMAVACVGLGKEDGRRVLLVVTDGVDRGGKISWRELHYVATTRSVAIFAVSVPPAAPRSWGTAMPAGWNTEPDALAALCDLTGGVLTQSNTARMKATLDDVVRMVRERYVLEFERPAHLELGAHDLAVKVRQSHATVRGSGISFPPVKAEERDTTGTASSESARSPEPGTRRVLDAPPPR